MRNTWRLSAAAIAITSGSLVGLIGLPAHASTQAGEKPSVATTSATAVADVRSANPTIVLVHGAFEDSSSWSTVIQRLRKDGYPVRAASTPLRGIASDAVSVRSLVDSIPGKVVLVGHSYGGAVINAAAAGDSKVKSLVYVAALVPDKGETLGELTARKVADPVPPLPLLSVPTGKESADVYLDPSRFHATLAGDLPRSQAAVLAATQRPVAGAAFAEPAATPAASGLPAWYVSTTKDNSIAPELQRFMAHRAGAELVGVNSSHVAPISHPGKVASVIETAAR